MGYGAKALQALSAYYSGDIMSVDESNLEEKFETFEEAATIRKVRCCLRIILFIELTTPIECLLAGGYCYSPVLKISSSPLTTSISSKTGIA